MPDTELFLFSDHRVQACTCGRILGGNYIELLDEPRGAARRRMVELRGEGWSHSVLGSSGATTSAVFGLVDGVQGATVVRERFLPIFDRGPGDPSPKCFCGGRGIVYDLRPGKYDDVTDDLRKHEDEATMALAAAEQAGDEKAQHAAREDLETTRQLMRNHEDIVDDLRKMQRALIKQHLGRGDAR